MEAVIFVATGVTAYRFAWPKTDYGWQYEFHDRKCYVTSVDSQGPAAGELQKGDQILAIDGRFVAVNVVGQKRIHIPSRDSFTVRVLRGSSEVEVSLKASLKRDPHHLFSILLFFLAALISLSTAVFVGMSKPDQTIARLFSITWMMAASLQLVPVMKLMDSFFRRRIRWVVYGSILGAMPYVFFFFGNVSSSLRLAFAPSHLQVERLFLVANLSLTLIPITVAYAIHKHRMFDIRIAVRRGVQYLLAKGVLQFFIYLPIVLILLAIRAHREQRIVDVLLSNTSYIMFLITGSAGLLYRKNLQDFLDRKFFREAYNSETILMTLMDQIKNFNSMSDVAAWVSLQLESALHPKRILIFYREAEKGGLSLGYSSGEHRQDLYIEEKSEILRIAEREDKSLDVISAKR
jgi:hypothetical protein